MGGVVRFFRRETLMCGNDTSGCPVLLTLLEWKTPFTRGTTRITMTSPSVTKCGPCACLFLCLLVAPPLFSWITALLSPTPDQVVLNLRGMEIPAVFKQARRNEDGSIDLLVNIPDSATVLRRLLDRQEQLKYNLTAKAKTRLLPNGEFEPARTYYPITMETPYVINSPDVCKGVHPLHVLVVVHTSTGNFQRRRLIRETWASRRLMTSHNQRLLFVLGLTANVSAQRMIENERVVYGDLVQGQFKDTYHNLTHKGVLAFRWIVHYCPHAQLILKVDDDMFVNPFLLYDRYFPRLTLLNRTLACHVRPKHTSPIERAKGKWKVQEYEFRGYKYYPFPYCNGYVVLITPDIVKAMYRAAYTTPFFWVDDVYLYGMLAAKVGHVMHLNIGKNMSLNMERGLGCYRKANCSLLATHVPQEAALHEVWKWSLAQLPATLKALINPAFLVA